MNRYADKQALPANARSLGKPAAVCELPTYATKTEVPVVESYPIGGLPLCDTEGVLGSFAHMMAVRDGHTGCSLRAPGIFGCSLRRCDEPG